jgi:hypothetical protein
MPNKENTMGEISEFEKELSTLINKHSIEGNSDTPDYILAAYMNECLHAFTHAVNTRDIWHGFKKI